MKILSEYLESLVKGFDPSRPVFFRKNVTDCEHWGDMADARTCVEEFIAPPMEARFLMNIGTGTTAERLISSARYRAAWHAR